MIALFTDYGLTGPYVGQLHAVLHREAPLIPVIDLMHDAPAFDARSAAYLLAALAGEFPAETVFMAVVDPGVGGDRRGAIVKVDGRWFVGPDNGLLNMVARRGESVEWWDITFQPPRLSASFHGRDIFAPVASILANGDGVPGVVVDARLRIRADWQEDLPQVVYVDGFGNLVTGLRATAVSGDAVLVLGGRGMKRALTFSDVPRGEAFWYENSSGLVEIAVNQGSAAGVLGAGVGAELLTG